MGVLTEALQPAYEAGGLRQDIELTHLSQMFAGMTGATVEAWMTGDTNENLTDRVDPIIEVFFHGARPA
jgi:hypothetical protein